MKPDRIMGEYHKVHWLYQSRWRGLYCVIIQVINLKVSLENSHNHSDSVWSPLIPWKHNWSRRSIHASPQFCDNCRNWNLLILTEFYRGNWQRKANAWELSFHDDEEQRTEIQNYSEYERSSSAKNVHFLGDVMLSFNWRENLNSFVELSVSCKGAIL